MMANREPMLFLVTPAPSGIIDEVVFRSGRSLLNLSRRESIPATQWNFPSLVRRLGSHSHWRNLEGAELSDFGVMITWLNTVRTLNAESRVE